LAAVPSGDHDAAMVTLPAAAPVELLHWPREGERRALLAARGIPCLVLVAADAELPASIGPTEDWVRLPADARDVGARAQALCRRLSRAGAQQPRVGDGAVVHAGARATLSAAETTALQMLLAAGGRMVSRSELEAAIWPSGRPSRRSLDSLMYGLRRRVAAVNIHVVAARGYGFVVDAGPLVADGPVEQ
jgi:hypothetical protein